MSAEDEGRTEEPTGKRKGEAREKGQVVRSADLSTGGHLFFGTLALMYFGERTWMLMQDNLVRTWNRIPTFGSSDGETIYLARETLLDLLYMIYPFMALMLVAGVAVSLAQTGWNWTLQPLEPKFGKIFSLSGLKKFIGLNPWVEALKGLLKTTVVGWVAWTVLKKHWEAMMLLSDMGVRQMMALFASIALELAFKISLMFLVIGIADYFWQRHQHNEGLKMTKSEVKDEARMSEGDPKVKGKLRQIQMQMAQKMMMKRVPEATVVITNPVFLAIALRYQRGQDQAPEVLAKGKRLIAERIRDLAREGNIPLVENPQLARAMYDVVEPGEQLPAEFFEAVAEVLAYVYRMEETQNG